MWEAVLGETNTEQKSQLKTWTCDWRLWWHTCHLNCVWGAWDSRVTLCVLSGHFIVLICFLWPHHSLREQISPSFKLDLHSLIVWGHSPVCNITAISTVNWICQSLGCGLIMCCIIKFFCLKLPANGIMSLSLLERVHSFIKLHNSQPIV